MQTQRAETYARCTAELDGNHGAPGAEAIFDQALTNGLAAIVSSQWGEETAADARGRVKSAAQLLAVVEEKAQAVGDEPDVYVIPDPEPVSAAFPGDSPWPWVEDETLPDLETRINVAVLREGIKGTQPVRHGSGEGGLRREHVDALLALDDHESLRSLMAEHSDRAWEHDKDEDQHSRARAADLLRRIGPEEAARRAQEAANLHTPYHPKHNPEGLDLDSCPICGHTAFSAEHGDELGMGVGVGECLVCHYERSSATANSEAQQLYYQARWADD
ncbi:hypothetical protein OHA69_40825 [Streptomyces anulatus]|uniref:hypothetical protein n=1 Tax=Streptomyces anulatus TaxID=1892 RepID=UPI002251BE81|nr:hypothetical protein [Streptomyces anulatus]MCX4523935.1 hypothetical protein [Streptomyces anulatus]WSU78950.1 hypothetical protein OG499_38965 [Streptomyces anulatus]